MFRQYCSQKRLFVSDASKTTHLLMDGGKLLVPDEELPSFLKAYVKCVNAGDNISLVEKLGPMCIMRFFLDVDSADKIDIAPIIEAGDGATGCSGTVYVCTRENGVHIVYNKCVTCDEALEICNTIKKTVPTKLANCIDTSVYKTGIRMVGSKKYDPRARCYIDRWYVPLGHCKEDTVTLAMIKPSVVRVSTIQGVLANGSNQCKLPEKSHDALQKTMALIHPSYKEVGIMGVSNKCGYMCIRVNSRYCTNMKCEHKSSNVYFVVSPQGKMYQKCFCKCDTVKNRCNGQCKLYKSKQVSVKKELMQFLCEL